MRRLGNTLYITTAGTQLSKEGETIRVGREDAPPAFIPIHGVDGVVAFGGVSITPPLLGFCAERGVTVSWFTERGRFLARAEGPVRGNVLLRRRQYKASEPEPATPIARAILIGKLHNQRHVLRRALRDAPSTGWTAACAIWTVLWIWMRCAGWRATPPMSISPPSPPCCAIPTSPFPGGCGGRRPIRSTRCCRFSTPC